MLRSHCALALALSLSLIAGCTSGPTRGFSLFPQGHKLLDTAKAMRDANARPLHIPRELEKQPLPSYTVEPGDVLLIQPADLDSPVRFAPDQPVLPDGTINLGRYGHPVVMGKTVPEIEGLVRSVVNKANDGKEPKDVGFISVRLIARQSKVYYVIGAVNSPGTFQLNGRETVLDGLMQAGGLTDEASRDNIILSRPSKPGCPRMVLPVCWNQLVQLGDTTTGYQLAPGDRIYVPSRTLCEQLLPMFSRTWCKCGPHAPLAFPPYPGDACHMPSNEFRGNVEILPPPVAPPLPLPGSLPK